AAVAAEGGANGIAYKSMCSHDEQACTAIDLTEILGSEIPVDEVPEVLEILGTRVTVVDVVSVFPDVTGKQRHVVGGERRSSVAGIDDVERTISLLDQPGPA